MPTASVGNPPGAGRLRPLRMGAATALALALVAVPAAARDDLVARGDYLVNTVMACGNCHTPRGPDGPVPGEALAGGLRFDEPPFTVYASNITQDEETGIGGWTDEEIMAAIVDGVGRDGVPLAPIMPSAFYRVPSARDRDAILAYLRTVPAVSRETPPPVYRAVIEARAFPGAEHPIPEEERAGDPVREGFYLATIAHCMECHTARPDGVPDPVNGLGAGGMAFPGPRGVSVAPNITAHPEAGIGAWTDAEIARAITRGVGRHGEPLRPPMGYRYYARMTADDVAAVVAWLRTVPPRP